MNKKVLIVPKGIRYISDWSKLDNGYSLEYFQFPHMVNKQLTGCGFTEYCITNNLDMIICSPRKILLENKAEQHNGEVFYFKNEYDDTSSVFDMDLIGKSSPIKVEKRKEKEKAMIDAEDMRVCLFCLKRDLLNYIEACRLNQIPVKILVTYDSFHYVKEFIQSSDKFSIKSFYVVIDECQSVMVDSRFKSDTELSFLSELNDIERLCYVSATPMLEKYLDMLEEFKDLPYFILDWRAEDETRVVKPVITVKSSEGSLVNDASNVINSYLAGKFERFFYKDSLGNPCYIESKEAVLYFNSVRNICDLIRKCKLTPDVTNVLCSRSVDNIAAVKKAFRDSCGRRDGAIGTVPKNGDPHKMFTLCTRTVYLGADFYSTSARTFVFSDPNIDCLAVDVSLDLPQIIGRQRLDMNPWKTSATLFYKTTRNCNKLSKEDFDEIVEKKLSKTGILMDVVNNPTLDDSAKAVVLEKYEEAAKATHYKTDYLSIDHGPHGELIPALNKLVMVAEMRAFDVQQVDYKDRFAVFSSLDNQREFVVNSEVNELIEKFDCLCSFPDKLAFVCKVVEEDSSDNAISFLNSIPIVFRNYITVLGTKKCAAYSYRRCLLDKEIENCYSVQREDTKDLVYSSFEVGKKYPLFQAKQIFRAIYDQCGSSRAPKAIDLEEFFDIRLTSIYLMDENGVKKKYKAYEILSKKDF